MQRDQFLVEQGEPWWLLKPDLDNGDEDLQQKRKSLGECWSWPETWYVNEPSRAERLRQLYNFLESLPGSPLIALDDATDLERRRTWLVNLIKAKQDSLIGAQLPAALSVDSAQRTEKSDGAKPNKTVAAPAGKASPFARSKPVDDAGPVPAEPAARPSDEPARKSIFRAKSAPTAANTPETEPTADGATVTIEHEQIGEAVKTVLADLSGDGISNLAQKVGLSPEEVEAVVQDPAFERMLADEAARLLAQNA